ncbi:hypothetical protein LPB19_13430 [Marinobacter salinisoli]|uniref:VIT domain-containing protein n=1 Tax=Marinobacter salinisoli TaxID=2769486 RepID=A0ABX7MPD9_9GAMM|nr:VIT domain-containing protein [Marinobacter salinisoli]QSP94182.1 hypothetical protein LPB19_13430 [Marinobacter salinisoli]
MQIQDSCAVTRIDQTFRNPGARITDAQYRFPLPARASVGQFTYWVAGLPIHGEVVKKQKANDIYHQEQQQDRKVAVSAKRSGQAIEYRVPVTLPDVERRCPELERMRAFAHIQRLLDEQETFGGGGAIDPWWLLLALLVLIGRRGFFGRTPRFN